MDNPWATPWDQPSWSTPQWDPSSPLPDSPDDPIPNVEVVNDAPDDDWGISDTDPKETQPPDQWEAARQEKEKLTRAVVRHLHIHTLRLIPQTKCSLRHR